MITVEQHLERILGVVRRLPARTVDLMEAQGRVLAADMVAAVDLPGFTNSAMDGYAVRSSELAGASERSPVLMPVRGDIAAGNTASVELETGTVMRIMTGAPLPQGADAVVPVELTDGGTQEVSIRLAPEVGEHLRERGGDVRAGEPILRAGVRLSPGRLALVAASGHSTVSAVRRPRVVVISTGDELVGPGEPLRFGQIADSNSVMTCALARAAGAEARQVGGVRDDAAQLSAVLDAQLTDADAIVTTGGVSMGAYDTVKEVLSRVGTMRFDKVAMRPGMPQGFGVLGEQRVPVFTLPGNPVSALVSFQVFVAPALSVMAGAGRGRAAGRLRVSARAGGSWPSVAGKTEFARVLLEDGVARLAGGQGSHMLGALAGANALAVVPPEVSEVRQGDVLDCLPLLGVEECG